MCSHRGARDGAVDGHFDEPRCTDLELNLLSYQLPPVLPALPSGSHASSCALEPIWSLYPKKCRSLFVPPLSAPVALQRHVLSGLSEGHQGLHRRERRPRNVHDLRHRARGELDGVRDQLWRDRRRCCHGPGQLRRFRSGSVLDSPAPFDLAHDRYSESTSSSGLPTEGRTGIKRADHPQRFVQLPFLPHVLTTGAGRREIQSLAHGLNLPDRLADAGQRYFNLAVNMNFVQGRRTKYVVAACLYSACRMDKTSHMLIDFSDLLEVRPLLPDAGQRSLVSKINVFVLGSTYLKLVKELSLQLPNVDPSLYISRFAALLDFGDETQKVAQDAVRLVARMGRDWMHIGRRPAGVCGACLLLAARMNNFRRSITEVVQVVKIADVTLRKRLGEFKETASGGLTVDDFRTLWLDEVSDPPAFARSQKKDKEERESLTKKLKKGEGEEAIAHLVKQMEEDEATGRSAKSLGKRKAREGVDEEDEEDEEEEEEEDEEEVEAAATRHRDKLLAKELVTDAITAELNQTLASKAGLLLTTELDTSEKKRILRTTAMTNLLELNDSERLDDLDEAELDCFILTEEEAETKGRLWMEYNKEYLQNLAGASLSSVVPALTTRVDRQTGPDGELRPVAKPKTVRSSLWPASFADPRSAEEKASTSRLVECAGCLCSGLGQADAHQEAILQENQLRGDREFVQGFFHQAFGRGEGAGSGGGTRWGGEQEEAQDQKLCGCRGVFESRRLRRDR